ncbi:peptidylprolyl isomerase [Prosthecomicrobium sp. N25]|uniref:peptidylprolyl isomerase n=1 Tax=Prosthecomicrobium sp. N25 TaxID=3129254 RepID=UPI003077EA4F
MLDVLRRSASGWVSKILLAFLIVSFGVWGIADVFRGFGSTTVAEVGHTKISAVEFDTNYRRQIDQIGRQRGRPISRDEALRAGLPNQLLNRMISDATLNEAARRFRLGVSDAEVVRQIQSDPTFQPAAGRFDRGLFARTLQQNGWSEDQYVALAREAANRQQLIDGVAGVMPAPKVLLEALNQYRNEERVVSYIRLEPSALGEIADPAPDVLQKFFEERKAAFRAPEYRKLVVLSIDPKSTAKPQDVTDDDAKAVYERSAARFGDPEKRRVDQIPFDKPEDAEAAAEKLKRGASFDDLMAERNLKSEDVDLGLLPKAGFLDPAIGDAAFRLEKAGDVSQPVKGRFRTVILRLGEVKPAGRKPFDEVKAQLKTEIAEERAGAEILGLHDQVEDARAGGARLEEIAKRFKLTPVAAEVDKTGLQPDGTEPRGLPEPAKIVAAAFESDVGVENDTLQLGTNGFMWFEVTGITPARDRTLDEVKDDVTARWKAEQTRTGLAAKAAELVARLEKGEDIEEVARSVGTEAKTSPTLKRGEPAEGLAATVVNAAFGGPEGHVATVLADNDARVVLKVKDVSEVAFFGDSDSTKAEAKELAGDIQSTLLDQYVRQLRAEIPATVNQQLVSRLVGTNPNQ